MKNSGKRWTAQELKVLKDLRMKGMDDLYISRALDRSTSAILQKRAELGMVTKYPPQPTLRQGKYTRAKSGVREVSILWGLIKWTRS